MKKFPKKLNRAVKQIRLSARNPRKLRRACRRYQDVFAVYPYSLDKLPLIAKNVLLSHDSSEEKISSISVTTPAECYHFYK